MGLPTVEQTTHVRGGEEDGARRARVLLAVHSAKTGGAERMALLEAAYLCNQFEILLSVPEGRLRSSFASYGELVPAAATLPIWSDSAWLWARAVARTLLDALAMARRIRLLEIDLVLTNSAVCLAAVLGSKLARVPVVVHARDVPKSRFAPFLFAVHGALADTVIVVTDGLVPYYRRGRRSRVVRIAEGVTIPVSPPIRQPMGSRMPLRLCLIGGVDPLKGQDIAVRALARLRGLDIEATLELVGREVDLRFADSVRAEARRLGVAENVELVGEVGDTGPYLDAADILIAPSRDEWTPLVLMEALARGVPVVAANVGGVEDIVEDGVSGMLVPPEDPYALAAAVASLVSDPEAAARMGRRGRARMTAAFAAERSLNGLGDQLVEVLANG